MPRKEYNKTGKENKRRQAETLELPRERDLDFNAAKVEAKWDMTGYDDEVFAAMKAVRERNQPIVKELDAQLMDKQRMFRTVRCCS